MDIYKNLYKGNLTEFDLINSLAKFVRKNKDHTVSNVTKFTRTAKYMRDEDDKVFIGYSYFFYFWLYIIEAIMEETYEETSELLTKHISNQLNRQLYKTSICKGLFE